MLGTMGGCSSFAPLFPDRYTYSLVFVHDMYETVFKKAPLDPELGKLYPDKILLVGGSRDDMDSLKERRACGRTWISLLMRGM